MLLFDSAIYSVISIDTNKKTVDFFKKADNGKGEIVHTKESFSSDFGTEEFYEALKGAIKIHCNKKTDGKTAVVLSDNLFFVDTIKLPVIQKKAMENSLSLAMSALYENHNELKYKFFSIYGDKQNTTYLVSGIREAIFKKIVSTVEEGGVDVAFVTFASNSAVCGAISVESKLKGEDFVLIDVKDDFTRISLAVSGKASGFFSLPIGLKHISDAEVNGEYEYFDHSIAEREVANAKALAKNKKIVEVEVDDDTVELKSKTGKTARRYPKFMIRETPQNSEGVAYENFRPILKWAQEIARQNTEIFQSSDKVKLYVNLPSSLSYLVEMAKAEDQNLRLSALTVAEAEREKLAKIDLYGAFYAKKSKVNLFTPQSALAGLSFSFGKK